MRRTLLLLVLVFAFGSLAPAVAEAGYWRCYKGCKARVRVCKRRCKRSGARWKGRRRCYKGCKARYVRCKRRCR